MIFVRTFFGCMVAHALCSFIVGKNFVDQTSSWSLSLWLGQLNRIARFTFGFSKVFDINDTTVLPMTSWVDILISVVMGLSLIQRYIFGLFSDLLLFTNTIMLWSAAKAFTCRLQLDIETKGKREREMWKKYGSSQHSAQDITSMVAYGFQENVEIGGFKWSDVYRQFTVIQRLAMLINIGLGSQVTWYLAEAVMYYSVRLNKFLTSTDIFVRVDLAIFYFTTFGILIFSADICSQVCTSTRHCRYNFHEYALKSMFP